MEMGKKADAGGRLPVYCYDCGFDLRESKPVMVDSKAVKLVAALDFASLKAVEKGSIKLNEDTEIYSHLYFVGLRQLLFLSVAGRRTQSFHAGLLEQFGRPDGISCVLNRPKTFENLRVSDRFLASFYAAQLLKDYPHRLVEVCQRSRTWSSVLLQDLEPAPFWLFKPVQEKLFVVHTPWRRTWRGQGASSYAKFGAQRTTQAPRSKQRRRRIEAWIRQHPELWNSPRVLAEGLQRAKLYSKASHHTQIARACRKFFQADGPLRGAGTERHKSASNPKRQRKHSELEASILKES